MRDFDLDSVIRKVPDFPKPGILFYDITSILTNPAAFRWCIDRICDLGRAWKADAVAGIEARGFLFGAPVAEKLDLPLVLVRKKGKLPGEVYSRSFALEYGEDSIEIHRADIAEPRNIMLVDDLIATGGTLRAAAEILTQAGSQVAGVAAVLGLAYLGYDQVLQGFPVEALHLYRGE